MNVVMYSGKYSIPSFLLTLYLFCGLSWCKIITFRLIVKIIPCFFRFKVPKAIKTLLELLRDNLFMSMEYPAVILFIL